MAKNKDLNQAYKAKKDEFYTDMKVIEEEMRYYRNHFEGKVIFCNCDDPFESNFFKYFASNFNKLKLKQLIATCYVESPIAGEQLSFFCDPITSSEARINKKPYKITINEVLDNNGDGRIDLSDVEYLIKNHKNTLTLLNGDGDFASEECIEILKQADIVITNPPFSKFRPYVKLLMDYDKHFLIIGNINAVTYKEIFPLIKDNLMWLGRSIHSGDRWFRVPNDYPLTASSSKIENGKKYVKVKGVRWFTNLDYKDLHEELDLYKKYNADVNPHYDNYDAIEVSISKEIPRDMPLDTVFGVPITFLDVYCPDQFDIIGMAKRGAGDPALKTKVYTKADYPNYSDLNATPVIIRNGVMKNTYPRILVRRKK